MTTWVFLRGLTRESRHWGTLPQRWELAGLGRPVLVDLPGNGTLAAVAVPDSVAGMVSVVRQQLSDAGRQPPYRILAMSLGAMVAASWAQALPEEIAALALVNTSMRPYSHAAQRLRPANWPALAGMAWQWTDRAHCERVIHRLTCARADTQDADIRSWMEIAASAPVSRTSALRQLLAAARFRADTLAPRCPTLLLSSAADRLVNPVCSARIAQAWAAPLLQHPWAGHDLPHDDPQWLCEAVSQMNTVAADMATMSR